MVLNSQNRFLICLIGFGNLFILISLITGCGEVPQKTEKRYIIKTSLVSISPENFADELDLKLSDYPYNIKDKKNEYNEMVIHLVKVLSEEIILLSEAAQIGVNVTDEEANQAESEFKKDYPEDSFEQMLLKNAISYAFWKDRFKKNMIIQRLIDQELEAKIKISSDDLVSFYQKYGNKNLMGEKNSGVSGGTSEKIHNFQDEKYLLSRIKRQKTEEAYDNWFKTLFNKYPVTINKEKLKNYLIDIDIDTSTNEGT